MVLSEESSNEVERCEFQNNNAIERENGLKFEVKE
jgi:hypothetical protein